MRTIKFRIWDKENKRMMIVSELLLTTWASFKSDFKQEAVCLNEISTWVLPIPENPIMQYTGLKDKNSADIFEGDIIEHKDCYYAIIFHEGAFKGQYLDGYLTLRNNHVQIIGNIYENPELLKGDKP